jgi:GntP family gluconate:H+ symporter
MQYIVALVIGIALLLFLVVKTRIQAFPALILTAVIVGLIAGLSPADTMNAVAKGFGNTLGHIGIIIGFGCIMGKFLEKSGAARKMSISILKMVGLKNADVVLGLSGLMVSIPVFCDSGFVILSELAKEFSRITKKSMVHLGGILGMGLYLTHFLVPPTPGPLAVAGFFKIDLGMMILCGSLLALVLFAISIVYFRYIGTRLAPVLPDSENGPSMENLDLANATEEVLNRLDSDELPSAFLSFAPIVLPIVLILLNTVAKAMGVNGVAMEVIGLVGHPIMAIFFGVLLSLYGLCSNLPKEEALGLTEKAMASAGLIMLVTGSGGALGNVIRVTNIGDFIAQGIVGLHIPVILVPLLMGAMIRIPQGSGTVAMITGGSILAPMISSLGVNPLLAGLGLCTTSMFVSYPNDSYFWVVTRFSGMDVKTSMKSWTIATALIPLCGSVLIIIASLFI